MNAFSNDLLDCVSVFTLFQLHSFGTKSISWHNVSLFPVTAIQWDQRQISRSFSWLAFEVVEALNQLYSRIKRYFMLRLQRELNTCYLLKSSQNQWIYVILLGLFVTRIFKGRLHAHLSKCWRSSLHGQTKAGNNWSSAIIPCPASANCVESDKTVGSDSTSKAGHV